MSATFEGFVRADGRVGTRNHIGVFIVGNCAATAARRVADAFTAKRLAAYPNVDGVIAFVHELGCGMEKSGEPMDMLRRTLGGSIRNPNIAGAVVMALGCERNNIRGFLAQEGLEPGPLLHAVVLQEAGGTAAAVAQGIAAVEAMLPTVDGARRQTVPVRHLVVGLQPGDVALDHPAQAALGAAVDRLVTGGGSAIISATAETGDLLLARSAGPVRASLEQRIVWWNGYAPKPDMPARPGHLPIAGTTEVVAACAYAEPVTSPGLVFMDSPAYEAVSATGQFAGGANLFCLLTAGGTAFGAAGAPTLKLAADSDTFDAMEGDVDIDCGPVADGHVDAGTFGDRLFVDLLAHASGRPTRAEAMDLGDAEFAPWGVGVYA